MSILKSMIEEFKSNDELQRLKFLSDEIQAEELPNIVHKDFIPKGPNIFLVLEVPGRTNKEIAFLHLERENVDTYIAVLSSIKKSNLTNENISLKRQKIFEINDHRATKILTEFAKIYNFLRGE